jgi:hypothetical protein
MNFFDHLARGSDAPGIAKTLWLPHFLSDLGPIQKRMQTNLRKRDTSQYEANELPVKL